jgi:hypothetical protein
MIRDYQSSDSRHRPEPVGTWMGMAAVLALIFVAVWMVSGELRPHLL